MSDQLRYYHVTFAHPPAAEENSRPAPAPPLHYT
jgi:hypothetical protein